MVKSKRLRSRAAIFRGGADDTKKNGRPRIPFRDLAKFAVRRKTELFLADETGTHLRTAKRWLSRASRRPKASAAALRAVLVDILSRVEF